MFDDENPDNGWQEENENDNLEPVNGFYSVNEDITDVTVKELEDALEILMPLTPEESDKPEYDEVNGVLIQHVIYNYSKKGKKTFTIMEAAEDAQKIIIEKALSNLEKEGLIETLIDEHGEESFRLTKDGNKASEEIKKLPKKDK